MSPAIPYLVSGYIGFGLGLAFNSLPREIENAVEEGFDPKLVATAAVLAVVVYSVIWPFYLRGKA